MNITKLLEGIWIVNSLLITMCLTIYLVKNI